MWWYIAFSIIFTIYAVDLVFLFIASLFAAVTEYFVPPLSTAATRAHKQQQKRNVAKQQQQAVVAKAQVEATKDVAASGKGDLSIVVDTRAHQVLHSGILQPGEQQLQGLNHVFLNLQPACGCFAAVVCSLLAVDLLSGNAGQRGQ